MAKPSVVRADPRAASDIDRHIGARIRARRLELRMSQEQLAEAIGVTFQQIQKYEKGVNRVSASMLYRITQTLDVQITALMPRTKSGGQDANPMDDPTLADMIPALARLNPDGRRLVLDIARTMSGYSALNAGRKK
ncbi:MAG: helix-turn-helix domain-containing protein [Hyphomonadaceae bacterium]